MATSPLNRIGDSYRGADEPGMKPEAGALRSGEERFDGVEVAGKQAALDELSVAETEGVSVDDVEAPPVMLRRHPGGEQGGLGVAEDGGGLGGDRAAALPPPPPEGGDHLVDAGGFARPAPPARA